MSEQNKCKSKQRAMNIPGKENTSIATESLQNSGLPKLESCPLFCMLEAREARWTTAEWGEKQIAQKRFLELGKTVRVRLPSSNLLYPRSVYSQAHPQALRGSYA